MDITGPELIPFVASAPGAMAAQSDAIRLEQTGDHDAAVRKIVEAASLVMDAHPFLWARATTVEVATLIGEMVTGFTGFAEFCARQPRRN